MCLKEESKGKKKSRVVAVVSRTDAIDVWKGSWKVLRPETTFIYVSPTWVDLFIV